MNTKTKYLLIVSFLFILTFLSGCANDEIEKPLKTENYTTEEDEVVLYYYADTVYINIDTEDNGIYSTFEIVLTDEETKEKVYETSGKCRKHKICKDAIKYSELPKQGTFDSVVTLENKTKAEFKIILPKKNPKE